MLFKFRFAAFPTSGSDPRGQQLSAELMLSLNVQQGSLHFMLQWIDLALSVSAAYLREKTDDKDNDCCSGYIDTQFFYKIVDSMVESIVGIQFSTLMLHCIMFIGFCFLNVL